MRHTTTALKEVKRMKIFLVFILGTLLCLGTDADAYEHNKIEECSGVTFNNLVDNLMVDFETHEKGVVFYNRFCLDAKFQNKSRLFACN